MARDCALELSSLRVFVAAAHKCSFKDAAGALSMTPSAVTQSIQALERGLGVALFDRSCRPMRLTPEGRTLARDGAELLEHARRIEMSLKTANQQKYRLRIGLCESINASLGPWLAAELKPSFSGIVLRSAPSPQLEAELLADRIDVLVCPEQILGPGLSIHRLFEEDYLLVTPHHIDVKTRADFQKLTAMLPIIRLPGGNFDRVQADRIIRSQNAEICSDMEAESGYAIAGFIAQGLGWSVMTPLELFNGREFAGTLRIQRLPGAMPVRTMCVAAHSAAMDRIAVQVAQTVQQLFATKISQRLSAIRECLPRHIRQASQP